MPALGVTQSVIAAPDEVKEVKEINTSFEESLINEQPATIIDRPEFCGASRRPVEFNMEDNESSTGSSDAGTVHRF